MADSGYDAIVVGGGHHGTPSACYAQKAGFMEAIFEAAACGNMIVYQMDRFRPTPELSGNKTPVENFYLCSSASHNGAGTGRGCSHNRFQVIKNDSGM